MSRRNPSRSVRVVSFDCGSPCFSRHTFGSLRVHGVPAELKHFVRQRRSSAIAKSEWE